MKVAVIPARGGSKRVPMKNVIPFHGKPIIAWSIEAALKSGCFDEVIVSTDSEEIAGIAREYGASTPFMRPAALSDDKTGTVPVIAHAVEWFISHGQPVEEACCIYATAPLIEPADIREGLRQLLAQRCEYVFAATTFSYPVQRAIRVDNVMRASMFFPEYEQVRSQELDPAWHDAAQFYWGEARAWLNHKPLFQSRSLALAIPRSRVHDLDTLEDLERLDMLFSIATAKRKREDFGRMTAGSLEDTGASHRLSLGTVQFGLAYGVANEQGRVPPAEAKQIIHRAKLAGIRALDTASAYGESEAVLGQTGVAGWEVTTKLPWLPDGAEPYPWMRSQVEDSLRRLGVRRAYAVLLHRPEQVLGPRGAELLDALDRLKQDGLVAKAGVSVYSPTELDELVTKGRFDLVQAPCSVLDQRFVETGSAARLKEMGIELHARSVFLQGLLLMPDSQRPRKFDRWSAIWSAWSRWLEQNSLHPVEACLLYALSIPEVDRVIVGVDGMSHLEALLSTRVRELPRLPQWPERPPEQLLEPSRWSEL